MATPVTREEFTGKAASIAGERTINDMIISLVKQIDHGNMPGGITTGEFTFLDKYGRLFYGELSLKIERTEKTAQ